MILFPDIEGVLVTHLKPLVGVSVSTRVPDPRPASFVRLRRVGGTRRDLVTDSALIVVECWAADSVAARDLGARTLAHVHEMPDVEVSGASIRRVVEVGGLQSFPDPVTDSPRYQFTVQIDTKGVAA
jgi:hypothetical protein